MIVMLLVDWSYFSGVITLCCQLSFIELELLKVMYALRTTISSEIIRSNYHANWSGIQMIYDLIRLMFCILFYLHW